MRVLILCVLVFFGANVVAQQTPLPMLPLPQQVEMKGNAFELVNNTTLTWYGPADAFSMELLATVLDQESGIRLVRAEGKRDADFQFMLASPDTDEGSFLKGLKRFQQEEAYRLSISKNRVLVHAKTQRGLFYGVQSIKQLLRSYKTQQALPGMEIIDYPDFEVRGMMDDISRGPVPTPAYMRQQIDRMAEMKINLLTYYTEHVVETEKHGAFAPDNGALTIAEWRQIADYARQHHIDLVGNFQSFGHFDKILSHPDYAHLGESGMLLSPAFDESYELLDDIYSEMIPAFHSDYFHINSDETFDLGTGASKSRVDSLGKSVVYAEHINRIYDIITKKDKKVMMWGDIILNDITILDYLPEDILPITWGYDIMESYTERITPFQERGYNPLISTGILNSYTMIPDFEVAKGNIGGFMAEGKRLGALGMLNTVWDDGGSAMFSRDWYGVAYAAEQSWNSDTTETRYNERFNTVAYGNAGSNISKAINELNKLAAIKSTEKMYEAVLWQQVIPDSGATLWTNIEDWERVHYHMLKADSLLKATNPDRYAEDLEYIQFTIDQYAFLAASRPALVEIARSYTSAHNLQQAQGSPSEVRSFLVHAYRLLNDVITELLQLKGRNQQLWLQENRSYALDLVEARYDDQLSDLYEVEANLKHALSEFDSDKMLPLAASLRLDIRETENWYFRGWLMIEPVPNPKGANNPGFDALEATGGLDETFPKVTQEFFYDEVKYRWKRVNTPVFAKVNLHELFEDTDQSLMHAFAHIDSPDDRRVRLLVGSSDGVDVYLNGDLVHEQFGGREFTLDEDEMWLDLKKGRNHLMLRLAHDSGPWSFSVTMPDVNFLSSKNRYRIVEE
ncbi:MAG: beta-N-acetylhexosaminidase [Bacteroidota bacterium]